MTIVAHLNPLSWFRKPNGETLKPGDTISIQSVNLVNEPRRCVHDYFDATMPKGSKELVLFCRFCLDVQRIPLKAPRSPKSTPPPQPRFAHIA